MDTPNVELVTVTPELAHEWLGFNTHNRPVRFRAVAAYAADMTEGNWRWNGDTVKFAEDGTLLDGQHRLAAVIEAGQAIDMLVVRGLENESQETMDGGAKRKFSDVLQLRGEANYITLAAIARRVATWESGDRRSSKSYTPTNPQLLQVLEKYPWLREVAASANLVASRCALPASIIGLCWWVFSQIDAEDAEHFFGRLADDQHQAKGNPVYELRRAAANSKSVRGQRSETYLTAITIKAWNAYRDGAEVGLLRFKPGGAKPETFPEPR